MFARVVDVRVRVRRVVVVFIFGGVEEVEDMEACN